MRTLKYAPVLLLIFLLKNITSYAQDTLIGNSDLLKPTHHVGMANPLPVFPKFPGGKDSLEAFIKTHIHYPKLAKAHNISGNVEVNFIVAVDGSIKNPKVVKPLGYGCDAEAIRIVNLMPKWEPATKGNVPMQLDCHVTIPFGNPTTNQ